MSGSYPRYRRRQLALALVVLATLAGGCDDETSVQLSADRRTISAGGRLRR